MIKHTGNSQPTETIGKTVKYITQCGAMHPHMANELNWKTENEVLFDGSIKKSPVIGKILEYEVIK